MSRDLAAEVAQLAAEIRMLAETWRSTGHRIDPAAEEGPARDIAPRAPSGLVAELDPASARVEGEVAGSVDGPSTLSASPPTEPEPSKPPASSLPLWSKVARGGPTPASASTLKELREVLGDCRRCALCEGRKQIVFGVGSESPQLAVVGEGPGAREDELGEPFVGPAGEMLDKMLENVLKRPRSSVYILNVVKCRPPGNRTPGPEEVEACRPFLERQLQLLRPSALLVLGAVAYKALFGSSRGIKAARGQWHDWRGIPAMPTFHPAYLLRQPEDKRLTLADLRALAERLGPPP